METTLSDYIPINEIFTSERLNELTVLFGKNGVKIGPWCQSLPKISLVNYKQNYDRVLGFGEPVFKLSDNYLDECFEKYGFVLNDNTRSLFREKLLTMCVYGVEHEWCRKIPKYLKMSEVASVVTEKEINLVCEYFRDYTNYNYELDGGTFEEYTNCIVNVRYHYKTLFDLCFDSLESSDGLENFDVFFKCTECGSIASRVDEDGVCFYGCSRDEPEYDFEFE